MRTMDIAHILLEPQGPAADSPELYYRADSPLARDEQGRFVLEQGTEYDFSCYFNVLSVAKWKRYTGLQDFALHLEGTGRFSLEVFSCDITRGSRIDRVLLELECPLNGALDIALPETQEPVLGFALTPLETTTIERASYRCEVEENRIHPTRISIAMTTFNNERYILPNIELFKRIMQSDDELADCLTVHIVDNGRTLDEALAFEGRAGNGLRIHPNINAGGAGGFTRGMMESLADPFEPTHVLLMDDDVSIFPESYFRTFNLLRLRTKGYENACISGAMVQLENPTIQHEDVGRVRTSGDYREVKSRIDLADPTGLVLNETISVEVKGAYGAWWYCCIPLTLVRSHGLPLPLFVRCDDVEYGMRLKPLIMVMNGICVWHASFEGRFRASVDYYQYVRNLFIANAVNETCRDDVVLFRFKQYFHKEISTLGYGNAELLLDGFEDFLKGPEFIMTADGAAIMKANGARNEKLRPVAEIEAEIGCALSDLYEPACYDHNIKNPGNRVTRITNMFEFDPHAKTDDKLIDEPAVIVYSHTSFLDKETARRSAFVALNAQDGTAALRTMDRNHYAGLMARYKRLLAIYRDKGASIRAAYRESLPQMTSASFWNEYLGLV